MSVYYSTQATLEAKAMAARVRVWGDKDANGSLDNTSMIQAFSYAKATILSYIAQRYGSQVSSWDSDSAPSLIKAISDDLSLYYLASGNNAINSIIEMNRQLSISTLEMIADYKIQIFDINDSSDYDTYTCLRESDFEENDDEIDPAWE